MPVEHHAPDCARFDRARPRRERDAADLAGRPPGWAMLRRLDPREVDDLTDACGPVPISGGELRRWRVRVTAAEQDGQHHLARVFLRDGEPVGAVIDTVPAAVAS